MSSRQNPPTVGDSGIVDLGALRAATQEGPQQFSGLKAPFHANDMQPSVDSDGSVVLTFSFIGADGTSDPLQVVIPAGLLGALLPIIPAILEGSVERYAKQAANIGRYVGQMKGIAADAAQQGERRGGAPTDLSDRRQ
jgi:hypothetical protein